MRGSWGRAYASFFLVCHHLLYPRSHYSEAAEESAGTKSKGWPIRLPWQPEVATMTSEVFSAQKK